MAEEQVVFADNRKESFATPDFYERDCSEEDSLGLCKTKWVAHEEGSSLHDYGGTLV